MLQQPRAEVQRRLSADGNWIGRWTTSIGIAVAVGIAYFLPAQFSLFLLSKPDGVALFWPAAGIASGALIVLGRDARFPVAAATIVATISANLLSDRTVSAAVAKALCNAGEALLFAWLIESYFGRPFNLDRLRHVLGLLAAAVVATAVSGIGGMVAIKLFHSSTASILTTWQNWFASDLLGILTIAPLMIGLASAGREPPSRSELVEGVGALAALAAMTGAIVYLPPEPWKTVVPVAMLFPFLLWLASRCRPVFASAAAFIVSLTIVWTVTLGIGHFGDPDLPVPDRVIAAQAGILSVALCAIVLAALFAERRQHAAALTESEARLQEALSAGAVTAFDSDIRSGLSKRSENAAQILGFDPKQPLTATDFLARVHPDDRARYKALVKEVSPDKPSYTATFRFARLDGREMWLEEASKAEFDAAGHLVRLKGLTRDVTERKRAEERQDVLMAELDHRVRNVLARVAAVAMSTRQRSGSTDEFVRTLNGRIQSMAAAHSLLSQSRWNGAGLTELVRQQLAPYTTDANTTITGSEVMLTAAETQAVAMVLHELVTNAAKYGALSTPNGRVSVIWTRQPRGSAAASLMLAWRELGGPPITSPIQSGYGASLIRELIPHELGGTVDLVFGVDGACCKIEIPLEQG